MVKKMTDDLNVLENIPLFDGLLPEYLEQIKAISIRRTFARMEPIFSEGDPGDGFYVVLEGLVKIYKVSTEGKEQILHVFGPGEPFGEVPVFSGKNFPANAMAMEPSALVFFPREDFVRKLTENPSLALNMLAVLSMRLRQFARQVEDLSLKEVPGRLAGYLLYLLEEQGAAEDTVLLNIAKGQLAALLGTIPETLSRIFNRMNSKGLIDVQGRTIHLLDKEALIELARFGGKI